jgi:hypothetical protein
MKVHTKLLMLLATMALGVTPAVAGAAGPGDHPTGRPSNHRTTHKHPTGRPQTSHGARPKAYGKDCQGESKKHVAGTPGTPFSKCVTDMAKLAKGSTSSPRAACKGESTKHVAARLVPRSVSASQAARSCSRTSTTPVRRERRRLPLGRP